MVDTDGIAFSKAGNDEFSKEERSNLLNELNNQYLEMINFSDDGYYKTVIVVKTKNYVTKEWIEKDQKYKVIVKGSGLVASMKEKKLKQFIRDFIDILLRPDFTNQDLVDLYDNYAKQIVNLKSMEGWTSKKTITDKILKPERTNELKIKLSIKHEQGVQEGDKIQVFFLEDKTLCLEKNFKGEYCRATLLKKLYQTVKVFNTIIPVTLFNNYGLKRNYQEFITKNTTC